MSLLHVIGFGLIVGNLLLVLCCWLVSLISMNWFINGESMDSKIELVGNGAKMWLKLWDKISGDSCKIQLHYYQYIGSKRVRKTLWKKLLVTWVVFWSLVSLGVCWYMSSQAMEKRKETLASMCDERARMLQDQFNVSMNHVQAMSILISTFHHSKNPSSIDQVKRLICLLSFLRFRGFHLHRNWRFSHLKCLIGLTHMGVQLLAYIGTRFQLFSSIV